MNNSQLQQCFAQIRNGDQEAFSALYHDMKEPVFTVICRITADRDAAEDVMQELFVKLYCAPPSDVQNLRAWIFKAARNLAIDYMRKPKIHELPEEIQAESVPFEDSVGLRLDIERALQQLKEEERELVTLHLNADLKFREIAEITNVPLGTVLWRYQKAILRLKNNFSGGMS